MYHQCCINSRCAYDNTPIPSIVVCGAMGTGEYVYHEKCAEAFCRIVYHSSFALTPVHSVRRVQLWRRVANWCWFRRGLLLLLSLWSWFLFWSMILQLILILTWFKLIMILNTIITYDIIVIVIVIIIIININIIISSNYY